ncbi:MAG: M20 family metallopeptidase [Lentisphaeria bacterium]|nr:M20 family metallopeptidase [Lentisphaeria bacterium]
MENIENVAGRIGGIKKRLRCLSDEIWNHPELAYKEYFAVGEAKKFLTEQGFRVENPCCGIETAFRAEYGTGKPAFAIFAEFDALPDVGHACGHNLICAAALGAFCAAADELKEKNLPGKIVLLGSPAEESGGGKVKMIQQGCLENIDAAMMVHPSFRATPDTGSCAITRFDVIFHGKSSHAAAAPELGINALAAVNLLFAGINAYREQIPENCRIHGIITDGGEAPNITPARAACRFFLRSTSEEWNQKIEQRFHDIVRGAELMTGARAEMIPFNIPYQSRKPNVFLNKAYLENLTSLGVEYVIPARGGRGSSDFGNVSQKVPGIHPYFPIADHEIAAHSEEFRVCSGTDFAFDNAMKAAAAMAATALKYLTEPDFKARVDADFKGC